MEYAEFFLNSIDLEPQDDSLLTSYFTKCAVGKNVSLIVGDSQNRKYPEIAEVDLLFIDGDHSYEGCTRDLENWYDNVSPGGHVLLHDCYFGCEVQPAVVDFIARHDVEVVQSPFILSTHGRHPVGSLAHLRKRR